MSWSCNGCGSRARHKWVEPAVIYWVKVVVGLVGGLRDIVGTEPWVNMEVVVVAVVWILVAQASGFLVGNLILILVLVVW